MVVRDSSVWLATGNDRLRRSRLAPDLPAAEGWANLPTEAKRANGSAGSHDQCDRDSLLLIADIHS